MNYAKNGLGVVLMCLGIHYGMSWPLPLLVFGTGMALIFVV